MRARVPGLLAAVACGLVLGCVQPIIITEYPVKMSDTGFSDWSCDSPEAPLAAPMTGELRYWSAYVFVDPHNIVDGFADADSDHVFVNAKVTIPTADTPLIRDFPLFTVANGVVEQHLGIDLLHKIPFNARSRE